MKRTYSKWCSVALIAAIYTLAGVAAIFGPGTPVAYSAKVVMQLLMQE